MPKLINMFANALQNLKKDGLSQATIAQKTGLNTSTVSGIFNGKLGKNTLAAWEKIAQAAGYEGAVALIDTVRPKPEGFSGIRDPDVMKYAMFLQRVKELNEKEFWLLCGRISSELDRLLQQ